MNRAPHRYPAGTGAVFMRGIRGKSVGVEMETDAGTHRENAPPTSAAREAKAETEEEGKRTTHNAQRTETHTDARRRTKRTKAGKTPQKTLKRTQREKKAIRERR